MEESLNDILCESLPNAQRSIPSVVYNIVEKVMLDQELEKSSEVHWKLI